MTADESDRYRRLTPDNHSNFRTILAIQLNAQDLVKRIKTTTQSHLHINTLPLRRQDFTPEIISAVSNNLTMMISRFIDNISHGPNSD